MENKYSLSNEENEIVIKELNLKYTELEHKYNSCNEEKEYEIKKLNLVYDECINVGDIKDSEIKELKSK